MQGEGEGFLFLLSPSLHTHSHYTTKLRSVSTSKAQTSLSLPLCPLPLSPTSSWKAGCFQLWRLLSAASTVVVCSMCLFQTHSTHSLPSVTFSLCLPTLTLPHHNCCYVCTFVQQLNAHVHVTRIYVQNRCFCNRDETNFTLLVVGGKNFLFSLFNYARLLFNGFNLHS